MEFHDYKKARDAAVAEIKEILKKRASLDERLGQLKKTVDSLSALLEEIPSAESYAETTGVSLATVDSAGISNAIRRVLIASEIPMSATDIRGAMLTNGFKLGEYSNAMAAIHNTLNRLEKQGELIRVRDRDGQAVYALRKGTERRAKAVIGSPGAAKYPRS